MCANTWEKEVIPAPSAGPSLFPPRGDWIFLSTREECSLHFFVYICVQGVPAKLDFYTFQSTPSSTGLNDTLKGNLIGAHSPESRVFHFVWDGEGQVRQFGVDSTDDRAMS